MSGSDGIVLAGLGAFFILPIIFGLAIDVGLAFLCAHIAKGKGNSAGVWFVLGLFFGVIAADYYLLRTRKNAYKQAE